MLMAIDRFERHGGARARALQGWFEHARDQDLYVTYTILNPQSNQAQGPAGQGFDRPPGLRIVDEDGSGITVHGAKMLGTGAVMANEVFVGNITLLKPADADFAVSFELPLGTPGVRILSRKSYEQHAVSVFDNPLSSRFDENDAVVFFDQVKVPWNRVFVLRDVDLAASQFKDTWAAPMQNHHSQIRLSVKLQFLLGLARRIAGINGVLDFPQVRDQLGRMSASVTMVESFVHAMEVAGEQVGLYFAPNRSIMHAATCITQELSPQFVGLVRELAGGGLIMLPSSSADFENPATREPIGLTQRSGFTDAYGRIKTMKLAWDAVGSEFGSRHVQYEMFYAGATVFQRAAAYRNFDWANATGLVDGVLSTYDLPLAHRPAARPPNPRARTLPHEPKTSDAAPGGASLAGGRGSARAGPGLAGPGRPGAGAQRAGQRHRRHAARPGPGGQATWAQPVVVDNRPGASGNIVMEALLASPSDGHTPAHATNNMLTANPHLMGSARPVPLGDVVVAAPLSNVGLVLVVRQDSPWKSLGDLLDDARRQPGRLSSGTPGVATPMHLLVELVKQQTRADLVHVPYKGGPLILNDVLAGNLSVGVLADGPAAGLVQQGRLRVLASAGSLRLWMLPDVPAVAETVPEAGFGARTALVAPKGTPPPREVCELLTRQVRAALARPEVVERLRPLGIEPLAGTPESVLASARVEHARFGELIRRLDLKA